MSTARTRNGVGKKAASQAVISRAPKEKAKKTKTKTVEVNLAPAAMKKTAKTTESKSSQGNKTVKSVKTAEKQVPAAAKEVPAVGAGTSLALTKELIVNPPESVLRPFRDAAKRNKQIQKKKAQVSATAGKAFLAKQPAKGKRLALDLRVHAPGTVGYFAQGGMPPGISIARLAQAKGVDVLGIAEYYNAQFIDVIQGSLGKESLTILPGMVVCCRTPVCQEVFLLCLFRDGTPSSVLYDVLKELQVPPSAYGDRNYCLTQDIRSVIEIIERNNGVIIPSRCDKTPYRQLALPTLVEEYGFHCFDLAHPDSPEYFRARWPNGEFTFLSFSSANALGQIGNRVGKLKMSEGGFNGVRQLAARR